jgi:hypothetical protein
VNGIPALAEGGRFIAMVPLAAGINQVAAVLTADTGDQDTHSVTIFATGGTPPLLFAAQPSLGVGPLPVQFAAMVSPSITVAAAELDFEGDGSADYVSGSVGTLPSNTYVSSGLHLARLSITDGSGSSLSTQAGILVYDANSLDLFFQSIWASMKSAVRSGAMTAASQLIVASKRERYVAKFNALTQQQRTDIDTLLPNISLVEMPDDSDRVEYQMLRTDNGQELSYLVRFVRDIDGVWRILTF